MKNRLLLSALLGLLSLGLAACGGNGKIHKPLTPTALYTFGDGLVDAGSNGRIYTVNPADASTPADYAIPHYVAGYFELDMLPHNQGGTAWAQGHSNVADTQAQIQTRLADARFGPSDVVLISAGMEDLVQTTEAVIAGSMSQTEAVAHLQLQARTLRQQWQSLYDHGARFIFMVPPFDLGQTPWMAQLKTSHSQAQSSYEALDSAFSMALNQEAEAFVAKHQKVLLKSQNFRFYMGAYTNPEDRDNEAGTSIVDRSLCAPPADVDASLCTENTLAEPDADKQGRYLFADNRHPTPQALRLLASAILDEMSDLWTD